MNADICMQALVIIRKSRKATNGTNQLIPRREYSLTIGEIRSQVSLPLQTETLNVLFLVFEQCSCPLVTTSPCSHLARFNSTFADSGLADEKLFEENISAKLVHLVAISDYQSLSWVSNAIIRAGCQTGFTESLRLRFCLINSCVSALEILFTVRCENPSNATETGYAVNWHNARQNYLADICSALGHLSSISPSIPKTHLDKSNAHLMKKHVVSRIGKCFLN